MYYLSTRDASLRKTAAEVIVQGLSRDGGLFTPVEFPKLPEGMLEELISADYRQRAKRIMKLYLEDFTEEELADFAAKAYGDQFDTRAVAPVYHLTEGTEVLELWHGPTCAFKDMALQMLPYLLTASLRKTGEEKTACILVATSGDTGKAALEGFCDVDHTKILVFYPKDGVSDIQKLQMVTQKGDNVGVCAVIGNFDDAQTGVKKIFSDVEIRKTLEERGLFLSSANSINWGRILPQVVYYISAYCDLCRDGRIKLGDPVNFCVPTGNFGNILAGYFAKLMGLPVKTLICASNANNVLTDFLKDGVYDRNREFYTTSSPSMDILISSNLERLLYLLSGSDEEVRGYMDCLSKSGRYEVSGELKARIHEVFAAGWCSDEAAGEAIAKLFGTEGYLMDTHTAVAYTVLENYRKETGDDTTTVVVSTASPYKFCSSVLSAMGVTELRPGTEILSQLEEKTRTTAPAPLKGLAGREVRFTGQTEKENMPQVVLDMLS
ncbi:MAG: threonine synthase [Oscillospiraceae bacterium]|nr:threonine synthase [Oscillospiraceae bacterium]